jgi:hypothetical protein
MKTLLKTSCSLGAVATAILVANPANAALVDLGPGSFTPLASVINFNGMLGQVNPSVNVNAGSLGMVTVSTAGSFVGQTIVGGAVLTLGDFTPTGPLTLNGGNTVVVNDGAPGATSPVLSGSPTFNGPIAVLFSTPVAAVGLKGGYFDAVGATTIMAFDSSGNILGSIVNSVTGFEFYGLADSTGQNVIAGISFFITGNEPAGFQIDDITFGAADVVIPVPEPSTYVAGLLLALPFGMRLLRTRKSASA